MANHKQNLNAKLISECLIIPKCEIEKSKQTYNLSAVDLLLLSSLYMRRGLVFSNTASTISTPALLATLKDSISHALVYFYPLAGRLATVKYEDDHACWIYVDCNTNQGSSGVKFIHAIAVDVSVSDILSHKGSVPSYLSSFFENGNMAVVSHDGHTVALVSVQVTELRDGVFIGFGANHAICDGTSFWHFVSAVSEIFMKLISSSSTDDSATPVPISRVPIVEPSNPLIKLPYLDPSEFINHPVMDPRLRLKTFHFSVASIAKLKAQANQEMNWNPDNNMGNELASPEGKNNVISSFQALSALVWRSISRARKVRIESHQTCLLAVDLRSRLHRHPLTADHFGNHVTTLEVCTKAGELLNNGLGWVANMVHKQVVSFDGESARKRLLAQQDARRRSQCVATRREESGHGPIVFTGSPRFNTYGPEFGLGKPVAVCSVFPSFDGYVKASPGREGGGSVDLDMFLNGDTVTALESDQEFMSFVNGSRW